VFQADDLGAQKRFRVHLCFGPNCTPRGSRDLLPLLHQALMTAGLSDEVEVIATSCRNRCETGPSVNVYPGPVFYAGVDAEAIERIVREHLAGGVPVERYRVRDAMTIDHRAPLRSGGRYDKSRP
jgi:(2Fe-2S) ferredoxin